MNYLILNLYYMSVENSHEAVSVPREAEVAWSQFVFSPLDGG